MVVKIKWTSLLRHPDIKAISFVGSVSVGQYIYKTGTEHLKRVQSFAGAKNHMVVMPDANKAKTIDSLVGSSVGAAGQRCMAISVAVFVGSSKEWIEDLKKEMEMVKPGPWDSEESGFGPLISPQAKDRVLKLIEKGKDEANALSMAVNVISKVFLTEIGLVLLSFRCKN